MCLNWGCVSLWTSTIDGERERERMERERVVSNNEVVGGYWINLLNVNNIVIYCFNASRSQLHIYDYSIESEWTQTSIKLHWENFFRSYATKDVKRSNFTFREKKSLVSLEKSFVHEKSLISLKKKSRSRKKSQFIEKKSRFIERKVSLQSAETEFHSRMLIKNCDLLCPFPAWIYLIHIRCQSFYFDLALRWA